MSETPHTAVVVSSDTGSIERLVTAAGFAVLGAAHTTFNGEQLAAHFEPDVVVLDSELPGEQDLAMIDRMRQIVPSARIVLIVSSHLSPAETSSLGLAAVVGRDELLTLDDRLRDLEPTIGIMGPDGKAERRSGRDRRVGQDWTKVGWEKRAGGRRAG